MQLPNGSHNQIPEQFRVIHFSDIHIWKTKPLWQDCLYPKRLLGGINLLAKRRAAFPPALAESVLADILEQEADLVVFSGDMTTASHPAEFAKCAELFAPLHDKWKERFIVIPGNHDRYSPHSISAGWYEQYFPYGAMQDGIRSVELTSPCGKPITIVGIDASKAFPFRSNGYLSDALADSLEQTLRSIAEQGRQSIIVSHYPVYYPKDVKQSWHHILLNKNRLQQVIETYPHLLYLHGHKHQRWVINNTINSGSCGMLSSNPLKQAGYVTIDYAANIRTVTSRYVSTQGDLISEIITND